MAQYAFAVLALAGCGGIDGESAVGSGLTAPVATGCDPAADADGDGLDDCVEVEEWGSDPLIADSDGDGFTDGAEVDCVSDPLDADEACYACGWPHGDPGTLVSTGGEVGDVLANLTMVDPCGESVDVWDFAGAYHILFMTAAW